MWGDQLSRVLGSPTDNKLCRSLNWFPEERYWSRLDEASTGTREDYRGALREINGDSPFTRPPLKVVWGLTSCSWRATSACGTWIWWPCRPTRGLIGSGARVLACLWHRVKRTWDINPPSATLVRMPLNYDLAVWKDASNVRPQSNDEIVWTMWHRNLRNFTFLRRPSIQTVSKALSTRRLRLLAKVAGYSFNEAD
jgi:hypothetical protein